MNCSISITIAASLCLAGCAIIPSGRPGAAPPPSPQEQASLPAPTPVPAVSPAPPSSTGARTPLAYAALGQTISVGSAKVTVLKILEDSRCPMNARCVWPGQVRLQVRVKTAAGRRKIEITSGKPVPLGEDSLELVEVSPDKVTNQNDGGVPAPAYRFGFRLTSNSSR